MPTPTYVPLATITLASADGDITFSSIPATYRDLIIVVKGELTALTGTWVRLNGNASNIYSTLNMSGRSGGTGSEAYTANQWYFSTLGLFADTKLNAFLQIMDYAQTDKHTSALCRLDAVTYPNTEASVFRWGSTDAVTSVSIIANQSTFKIGSTFSLYGVN